MFRSSSLSARAVFVLFVALTTFWVFGSDLVGPALAQQQTTKPATPAAALFNFTVKITYSEKAMSTLVAGKETVIVAGYLTASPIAGTPKQYVDRMGEIGLGEVDLEIAPGAVATFSNVKPTPAMMK
jgi:hypothetical protein